MMTGIWEELLPALTKKVKQAMAPPPKQIKVEATAVKCICVACSKGMKCTRQKWRDLMGPPLKQQVTTSALPSQAEELSPSPVPRKPAPKAAVTAAQVIKGLPAPAVLSPEPAIPAGQSSLAFCVKAPLLKTHTHTHTGQVTMLMDMVMKLNAKFEEMQNRTETAGPPPPKHIKYLCGGKGADDFTEVRWSGVREMQISNEYQRKILQEIEGGGSLTDCMCTVTGG